MLETVSALAYHDDLIAGSNGFYGAQSPGVPDDGAGGGPDGGMSPAQIVSRPQDRSTRANGALCSTAPPGRSVVWTSPGLTCIDVRIRPDGDRASTFHGSGGSEPGSIVGGGPPGG